LLRVPADRLHRVAGLYAITPDTTDSIDLVRRTAEAIAGGAAIVQ
jgi:hypothetical protein